eukprot:TRINITY_DN4374_c0_g1_i2.p1 TRINITY_DN4374_c0_g1~~TRINITY_DN4374_c0_g1_i2.p1  ORF type:complete len:234 (-),score=21.89 TRINITY_DN4374_c0_g1_i2:111-812(-)
MFSLVYRRGFCGLRNLSTSSHELKIVFEDKDFVFVNKPSNLATSGTADETSLIQQIQKIYKGEEFTPHVLASMDKPCSGITIFAKHQAAEHYLNDVLHTNQIIRGYLVGVLGKVKPLQGKISAGIIRSSSNWKRFALTRRGGKEVELDYFCLGKTSINESTDVSVLAISTLTQRQHQIRAACSAIQSPIVGDELYQIKSMLSEKDEGVEGGAKTLNKINLPTNYAMYHCCYLR